MSSFASWLTRLKENVIRPSRQTGRRLPERRKTYRPLVEELEPRLAPAYSFDVLAAFESSLLTGGIPAASLIQDTATGYLFGTTTTDNGTGAFGTVFEQPPNGSGGYSPNTAKTLYSFSGGTTDGAAPYGNLVQDTATGNLFGTTTTGVSGFGSVFQMTTAGTMEQIYAFSGGATGAKPYGGLVEDSSHDFFGTTESGGDINGDGTAFELTNTGGTYSLNLIHTFNASTDGANPYGSLVLVGTNLFGTTSAGGANGAGTVFELSTGGTYTTLYSFTGGTDGGTPLAGLVVDGTGDLFGTTKAGGNPASGSPSGTVFEMTPNGSGGYNAPTTLYSFTGGADGANPLYGNLVEDGSGNLFGTTSAGGNATAPSGAGTVFELANSAGTYSLNTLYTFTGGSTDGGNPNGGLFEDTKGDLFGTTNTGGTNGAGTLFELATQSIVVSGGDGQTGTAGSPLGSSLAVKVADTNGNPVSGVTVTWVMATGGGSIAPISGGVTDSNGIASATATLGTTAGSNTYTATVNGLTGSPVTFTETGIAGPAKTIASSSGGGQTDTVGKQLTSPLVVTVTDANNNPVSGVTVNWAAATGGGKVSAATVVTGSNGQASITATLGTTVGANTYTATVSGLTGSPITFSETATVGAASKLVLTSGNSQSGLPGTFLASPLTVSVTDQFGNPISGTTVNWAAVSGGGFVSAATSVTGTNGQTTINATLGSNADTDTFTATVSGLSGSPVTFTATVTPSASGIISGVAFFDAAGSRGAGSSVLGGLNINLVGTSTGGLAVNLTASTNADGFYSFINLKPGTYQLLTNQTPLNSPGATITVKDGQVVNQDVKFLSYVSGEISLRLFLNTTSYVGFSTVQNNQPVVINPIQNVSVSVGSSPTVINLAGNFSEADLSDPVITFSVSTPGNAAPKSYAVELFGKLTPQTVANFLAYIESGEYKATVFHRVQQPSTTTPTNLSIIQGGGFSDNQLTAITTDPDVQGEPGVSNTVNTLAMALSNGANTGNSQFFFNTADNSGALDPQSFTVFGKVIGSGDQTVLNALTRSMFGADSGTKFSNFNNIPIYNYSGTTLPGTATPSNYAVLNSVTVSTPSAATLTYAIVSNSNPGLVTATLGDTLTPFDKNLLTLNYVNGATGSAVITVQAINQNGASVTTSFTVTVA